MRREAVPVEMLCALFVVLCVIALALIGAWTVYSSVISGSERRAEFVVACRNCGRFRPHNVTICPDCGLIVADADEIGDLNVTERLLKRFHASGVLDQETY